ncbi:MAG: ImmA/IrrE family metallo-endopeptidase [Syntrophomonas sp.]|nr:ImmA/IrrE family metallo-endopeptidase [Proteiniphilum sp.]MDD3878980.1 ImmA/IrrE family metallo-endopeptidase [Syntrophomonas sp.]
MEFKKKHYTLDMVPEHRQEFIDLRIREFCRDYGIKKGHSLDTAKLLKKIQNKKLISFKYGFVDGMSDKFEAQARYYPENNIYMILINKRHAKKRYPYKESKDRRLNFTIAHELGHILLDHLLIPDELKSDREIDIEHEEAQEFAGRLLMPKDSLLSCNFVSLEKVADKFNVSKRAVWKRLNNLKRLELLKSEVFYVCETCGNSEISLDADFCRICGQSILNNNKGVIPVKYAAFELDENNHALECPVCGNDEFNPAIEVYDSYGNTHLKQGIYCRICASILVNRCTNEYCEELAAGNSRYCEYCASPTTFFNSKYLPPWEEVNEIIKKGLTPKNGSAIQSIKLAAASTDTEEDEIPF